MKFKFLWVLLFAFATAAQATSLDAAALPPPELKPSQEQAQAAHLAARLLTRHHYKALPLDEAMSAKIFDQYLKSLDSEKVFFVQADIDQLTGLRAKLGDAIIGEDLGIPFSIFNLYTQRVSERFAYARSLLKAGFDFQQKETYQYDREKEAWPNSDVEMRDLWRKRVKNDWLRLRLAGQDDKRIAETLDKRYGHALKRLNRVSSEDAFETFMNAYTMAIDPHTNYMGPRVAEDFDISMKLSLVGIGASLEEKDDYTTIRELLPGGPAMLSGKLRIGDRIVGVAQSENGVMTDIVGWRPDDTVALIRGPADTRVLLDVLPAGAGPDGKHKLVSLIRKKISLKEQAAKKTILSVMDGKLTRRLGVIALPVFYQDFQAQQRGDKDFKSATRDVARLLKELKNDKVDGVLVDLRNNGGGSLMEAIELTGLFIGNKPVVQERDAQGHVAVASAPNEHLAWDGPLAVLINRGSASASEIFAAAIQDYGRGLVIGEPSFGKGTVQTVINLDQIAENDKQEFGELKMTVAQFFRVNGGTTQFRGVTPDIGFPTVSDMQRFGESSFDNALPWAQVKAADYLPMGDVKAMLPILAERHEARIKTDNDFRYLQQDIAEFNRQRESNVVSLNEADRRNERAIQEARLASREARNVGANNNGEHKRASAVIKPLRDDGLQAEERDVVKELAVEKARDNAKDVLLNEAVHILNDEVGLLKPPGWFTASARQGSL